MGKFGKILAPMVAVFAIAALVLSFLIAKQGKLFRQRAEILAEGLSKTASTLDSGSGDAQKASFKKSDNGAPESGPLGWPEFAKGSSSYEQSVGSVNALAKKVIDQRDAIIEKLVEIGDKLKVEGKTAPDAESLQGLATYEEGLEGAGALADDWVSWNANVTAKVNDLASKFSLGNNAFQGKIMAGGSLSGGDVQAFTAMGARTTALQLNYRTYRDSVKEMVRLLTAIQLHRDAAWKTNPNDAIFSNDGMGDASAREITRMMTNFRTDFNTLKSELAMIDELQAQLADLQQQLEEKEAERAKLEAKFKADEEVIENYYRQGLGMNSASRNREQKNTFTEVEKDLSGNVLQVDVKYGYIIVNLTNCDVYPGLNLSVHRRSNGDFLGMITVLSAGEFNSIATIVVGDIGGISAGDKVVIGSSAVQEI